MGSFSYPVLSYLTNNSVILQNIQPTPTFSKLVIVEPMVSASGHEPLRSLRDKLIERAKKRQAVWRSREDLKTVFTNPKHSAAKWDPRVLDSFAVSHFPLSFEGVFPILISRNTHCTGTQSWKDFPYVALHSKKLFVRSQSRYLIHLILVH